MRFYLLSILIVLSSGVRSQDTIVKKDKEEITCRIVSEEKKSVLYYSWNDTNFRLQEIDKKEVKKIRWEDPPPETDRIIIRHTSLSGKDFFSDITSYLLQNGYQIERFDTDLLKVITKISVRHRIIVDINENSAEFTCFHGDAESKEEQFSTGAKNTIRLSPKQVSGDESEDFPGEVISYAGEKEFKAMDKICRKYLVSNKGVMNYDSD